MSRTPRTAAAALLVVAALGAGSASLAQADAKKEALLLYLDGKFDAAETLLSGAGPEVAGDPALRAQLADAAARSAKSKQGEDRRAALVAIRRCWGAVVAAKPDDAAGLAGALSAARDLAALDIAAKKPKDAKTQVDFAIGIGEKAPAAALDAVATFALAECYAIRGVANRSPDTVDAVLADYDRAAQRYESAVGKHPNEAECLSRAARARFDAARFIHDTIPIDAETRDETSLRAAIDMATKACQVKAAPESAYAFQLTALATARSWKLPGDLPKVFTQPLTPPYEGLKLEVPRGGVWKLQPKTAEWDVVFERKLEEETSAVQAFVTIRDSKSTIGGRQWAQHEEAIKTQYESRRSPFTEGTAVDTPPQRLGGKKGQVFFYEVGGMRPDLKRPQRIVEFVWPSTTLKDVVWDLCVIDWRRPSSIDDPDIVAFVASAIGPGLWPPAAGKDEAPDPKKKPGGGKKK
jgi:hypothetical protein